MTLRHLTIWNRLTIRDYPLQQLAYSALICVTDPGRVVPIVVAEFPAVVSLQFEDRNGRRLASALFGQPLTVAQSQAIASFVLATNNDRQITTLAVMSEVGLSRAPGIALAICQELGLLYPAEPEHAPNSAVVVMVRDAIQQLRSLSPAKAEAFSS